MTTTTSPTDTTDQTSTSLIPPVDGRVRISLAGAGLLALTGSVLTAIYVRNQARARAREFAWVAMLRSGAGAWPGPRRALPLGGVGGSLLVLSAIAARRRAQAQMHMRSDRPAARDVLLGVALGLGAINVLGRAGRA
jgi:hypothetical protein